MPCYDDRDSGPVIIYRTDPSVKKSMAKLEAMLCQLSKAVVRLVSRNGICLSEKDWDEKEAGISFKEYQRWYSHHCEQDEKKKELVDPETDLGRGYPVETIKSIVNLSFGESKPKAFFKAFERAYTKRVKSRQS